MTTPALEATSLYRFFHTGDDEVLALRGVSFHADPGEVVAVVGPSGSGKSTLLACCAGLDEPDGGTVTIGGRRMTRRSEAHRAELRAAHVGMMFQSDNLVAHLDIAANLRLAQQLADNDDAARRADLLDRVGLGARVRALPRQLSGGELVRAALAVALVNEPAVLLADEPTGELDSVTEQAVVDLILAQRVGGCAAVLATHSDAVAAVADRVVKLVDGSVLP